MTKEYVGFFDSGVGGLAVLQAVKEKYPNLDIIYFGDNNNAPYGQKSQEEIITLTKNAFAFLKEKGYTKIVTACNSVSAVVNQQLAEEVGIDRENIIEMSKSTVRHCIDTHLKNILVLSTEATQQSGLYRDQFLKKGLMADSIAINGLVDLIESGGSDNEKQQVIQQQLENIDLLKYEHVVLACTHFPWATDIFKKVFSEQSGIVPNFINPAVFVSDEVLKRFGNEGEGETIFYFSKESEITRSFVEKVGK